jgi:two-component system cell cycle response regulator DivK
MTPLRVLVVDDNPLNLELVSFVLGAEGMEVVEAVDAEQAQAKLTGFKPDLVLMDVQLPGLDGLALTRLLKADQATRHMKVVAFTAYAMKGDEGKMRAAGCDGYLAKPIDVATFAEQVRAIALAPP